MNSDSGFAPKIDQQPEVSVVIPTHNRAGLLPRAIRSVLAQTFESYEIIVIDDCSNDDTEHVIAGMHCDRLTYHRLSANVGGGAARNRGIEKSSGRFIAFLDSDDEWLPDRLSRCIEAFKSDPQADIVYSNIFCDDGVHPPTLYLSDGVSGTITPHQVTKNYIHLNTVLAKREVFRHAIFDEQLPKHQDWDWGLTISRFANFRYIDIPLAITYTDVNRPRINTNLRSLILGHERFIAKHYDLLAPHRAYLSTMYYDLGHALQRASDSHGARRYFRKALRLNAANIKAVAACCLSMLGHNLYMRCVRLRQKL